MSTHLPKLLATSVVRGSQQGESHGGIYLIDMEKNTVEQKVDWNTCAINFDGRGADRGLRGIAYYRGQIYITASDEVFIFDQDFNIVRSIKNPFLKHCHEICIWQDRLYLTSTGFDSILVYDLTLQKFVGGLYIALTQSNLRIQAYDPTTNNGPQTINRLHLNTVYCDNTGLYFSGRKSHHLYFLRGSKFGPLGEIPLGTHNAQPYLGGIIYNDTNNDRVCYSTENSVISSAVPTYSTKDILNVEYMNKVARPSFGRGLCPLSNKILAAGSSPSTISLHDMQEGCIIKSVNISMCVRNAIHGLEEWPF